MKKIVIISLLVGIGIIIYFTRENYHVLNVPEKTEVVSAFGSSARKVMRPNAKVVAYFASKFSLQLLESYEHYRVEYPNIEFQYYIHASEKKKVIDYLKANGIKAPVYYDRNNDFKKLNLRIPDNVNFIGFIVDEDNRIIKMTNPTVSSFEQLLKKYN